MKISCWVLFFWLLLSIFASGSLSIDSFNQAFPIIEPDPGHTKLRLSSEGLEAIKRITNPIAAVSVIGPYRSGKSFLLNQLLSLSCYEGFGVGHMRDTKTKGIWVWGTPLELDINGVKTSVFYLDTEGFESIGKSNVYDDRIFALATVLSSVLIYNLPETKLTYLVCHLLLSLLKNFMEGLQFCLLSSTYWIISSINSVNCDGIFVYLFYTPYATNTDLICWAKMLHLNLLNFYGLSSVIFYRGSQCNKW
uniref:GB1/RHD3-type G domain-containing protein n=1 Tax=Salix viminalis TaxID=40686 RepID=A0A6N2L351_SALVM